MRGTLLGDCTLRRKRFVTGRLRPALRLLRRHHVISPRITPLYTRDGKRISSIERWQLAGRFCGEPYG